MERKVILFLDFDGVLHPDPPNHENPLFCRAALLNECLLQHPEMAIVISSTWRKTRTLNQLQALLPGWTDRIVGATSESSEPNYARQFECEQWMRENAQPWTHWVCLDDRSWNFRPFEKRLILVDGKTGLTSSNVEQLNALVNRHQ